MVTWFEKASEAVPRLALDVVRAQVRPVDHTHVCKLVAECHVVDYVRPAPKLPLHTRKVMELGVVVVDKVVDLLFEPLYSLIVIEQLFALAD